MTSRAETGAPPKDRDRGQSRSKRGAFPKGRDLDDAALAEVRAVLGDRPRRRDLLIEHLHLLQDAKGCLPVPHLAALAHEMGLSQVEVYETATFYAHFDVVREGEEPPPPLTVRVCESLSCAMAGAERLRADLAARLGPGVRVVAAPCMGRCDQAPVVEVGRRAVGGADAAMVERLVAEGAVTPVAPPYIGFDAYVADGGYDLLKAARAGSLSPDTLIDRLAESNLRGLGGAGFPAGRKWRAVAGQPKPRLLAVNADEGEPGTFKDRFYLESDPHRFIEGMLLAAWATECAAIYVYVRDEYPAVLDILRREIAAVEAAGLTGGVPVELRRGAGAYICGEESAMLESLEGKRGYPRHKPPFPSERGLFGRPTLTHNVETLYWVRDIVAKGPQWFAGEGRNGRSGLRSFSVSGRVRRPGVKLAPAGITAQELIDEFCGGMLDGHTFKAYLPGGASGGILPASKADVPLDFDTLQPHGCFIGSAAVIVLSDRDDMRTVVRNLMRFFAEESCGQCTPCRVGTKKALAMMDGDRWDTETLRLLSRVMADASICGLGQAAPNPLLNAMTYFPEDFA